MIKRLAKRLWLVGCAALYVLGISEALSIIRDSQQEEAKFDAAMRKRRK